MKFLLALALVTLTAASSFANGRPPNTTSLVFAPDASQRVASLTFGIMVSHDSGRSWRWVCEEALGGSTGTDWEVLQAGDGTLAVMSTVNLVTSTDGGCSWTTSPELANLQPTDMTPHPTDSNTWLVVGNTTSGGQLWQTHDAGRTFSQLPLQQANVLFNSVRFAPNNGSRILIAGFSNQVPYGPWILRSDDAGNTWSNAVIAGQSAPVLNPVLAINPVDANNVLIATSDLNSGAATLWRSTDAGRTVTQVTTFHEKFRNMTFSSDGKIVWVASINTLRRSTDSGVTFALLPQPVGNACVTFSNNTLFACGSAAVDPFALAQSADLGTTWQTTMTLNQLLGPLACAAGTITHDACEPLWAAQESKLGAGTANPSPVIVNNPTKKSGCNCNSGSDTAWAVAGVLAFVRRRGR